MTISSSTRKAGPYTGNGSTTVFSFSFKVFTSADLQVVKTDLSGVESTLVLGTDYTVSLNANQNSNPGGSITMLTAPATGILTTITSNIGYTQNLDLTNQGGFYPTTINDALDRATIQIQQLNEQVGRSVKVNISSSVTPDQLINTIITSAASATTAANNASTSATNAANSATSASTSATTASTAATTATTQASAASTSATNAAASATTANTAATNASASATSAGTSATNAASSASTASTAATTATTQATNAATSATTASNAATTATTQATAASTSATNAAASATSAAASAASAAQLNVTNNWTKAQRGNVSVLTYAATITPDFAASNNFSTTLTGNATLANPTNLTAGQSGVITITQDATGSRTLAFGSYWKFSNGTAPTLTTTASAVDDLAYYVESSTRIVAKLIGAVA